MTVIDTDMIYTFIRSYIDDNGIAPSYQEIRDGLGISSTSVVAYHMAKLISAGKIERSNRARSIRILDANNGTTS